MIKSTLSVSLLVLLPFFTLSVYAENDWKTPCLDGVCQYSVSGSSSGTVKIWGSPDAITDITTAAGWEMLDCSPDELSQDIRLVCQGDESPESACAHLYQNIGAEGKIVRLPENCGKTSFARIAKAWIPKDQSIPDTVAKRLVRRDGVPPVVKALRLDTDFAAAAKSNQAGLVYFAIQAANFAGANVEGTMETPVNHRRSRLTRRATHEYIRGLIGGIKKAAEKAKDTATDTAGKVADTAGKATETVGDTAGKAAETVGDTAGKAAETVGDTAGKAAETVGDTAGKVADTAGDVAGQVANKTGEVIERIKDININQTIGLHPVDFAKSANIFSGTATCPPLFDAKVNVDVNSAGSANIGFGIAAIGSLVPPQFDDFMIFAGLDADLSGSMTMTTDVQGSLDSGRIKISQVGIPGLSIPGIITVGPTATINVQAVAQLDVNMNMTVGFNYKVQNAQLYFPPKDQISGGDFSIKDTPLNLFQGKTPGPGFVEAHFIPGINFGISAIGTVAETQVFLELDATANLTMSFAPPKNETQVTTNTTDTTTPDGCLDMKIGMKANAGARSGFFSLFNERTQVPLFNKNFQLFKKCFGDPNANITAPTRNVTDVKTGLLQCLKNKTEPILLNQGAINQSQILAV
ncbi:hypothetical protein L218DRAFT_1006314 [Marasmius fiardii PR-910]|nr:hypothetical protein L218DRAFT_1006314 [Marasmius fiardii PR-910]